MRTSSRRGGAAIKSTIEQIADRIRDDIEEGVLAPGVALNQVELADSFGLSRIPIREALRQLEAEGYVASRANKGATVIESLPSGDILEIIEIRECVELRLMDHAVEHLTPGNLDEAQAALRALNLAKMPAQLRGAHEKFHTILFDAAKRPRMVSLINGWRFRVDERPDTDGTKRRAFAKGAAQIHGRLLAACVHRDKAAVRRCVVEEHRYLRSIATELRAPLVR